MGVEYSSGVMWGLKVGKADCPVEEDRSWWEWLEDLELPEGFSFVTGGNAYATDPDYAAVIGPGASYKVTMEKYGGHTYGVQKINDMYQPTGEDWYEAVKLSRELDVAPEVGWFAISSVS